jgi:hypothetical protein
VSDLWTRHGDELDAAVVDTRGGTADDRRLLRTLRSRRPDLPSLALFGPEVPEPGTSVEREAGEAVEAALDVAVLRTPFTLRGLCDALGALLAKRDAPA